MADSIVSLLQQNATTSIAFGGALVAAVVSLLALKVLSNDKGLSSDTVTALKKKKKNKTKKKRTIESDDVPVEKETTSDINLEEFVDDGPDSEEEVAIRAEKRKLKLKLKKKNAKAKQRAAVGTNSQPMVDTEKEKEKKKAAAVALKQDVSEGWETVVNKKKTLKAKQQ